MNIMIGRPATQTSPYPSLAGTRLPGPVDATRRLIEEQGVIGHLPERDLLDLAQRSQVRTVRAREHIYHQGDPGRAVVAVLQGYVKLSTTTAAGREVVQEIVASGNSFGELAVLNNWVSDSDAITLSRCRLLTIEGRQFTQVMERSPEGMRMLVHLISDRLRIATQRVLDIIALPAPARLAKTLLHLAELQCRVPRDGVRLALRLSQAELGGMTGLTRESVNKQLASLRDAGLISLADGAVTLLGITALENFLSRHDTQQYGLAGPPGGQGAKADAYFTGPGYAMVAGMGIPALRPKTSPPNQGAEGYRTRSDLGDVDGRWG